MPDPKLPVSALGQSPEERVVTAILKVLEEGPELAFVSTKILKHDGEREKLPKFDPDETLLPCVRFMASTGTQQTGDWENEQQHRFLLSLGFELWVPGTHCLDRFRMVHAFRSDLFPSHQNKTVYTRLLEEDSTLSNWVRSVSMVVAGNRVEVKGEDDYAQVVNVVVRVVLDINT